MHPIIIFSTTTANLNGDVSFLALFRQASPVVQAVMIGLLLASVWSWAIIVEKLIAFRRARSEADRFEQMFWSGQSLEELYATLSRGRTFSMARCSSPPCASGSARSRATSARSAASSCASRR